MFLDRSSPLLEKIQYLLIINHIILKYKFSNLIDDFSSDVILWKENSLIEIINSFEATSKNVKNE